MTSAATPSTMTHTAKIMPKDQTKGDGQNHEASDVPFDAHGGVLHHPGMPKTNAEQIAQEQRS